MAVASDNKSSVWKVRLTSLAVLALLGLGVWANLPYLKVEHHRLESWKIIGMWTGDVTAFFWFLQFAFSHGLLGKPLSGVRVSDGRKQLRRLALVAAAAMLVDFAFTLEVLRSEWQGYRRGVTAEAQVIAIKVHKRPEATSYGISCSFRDSRDASHNAYLRVLAKNHEFPNALPLDVQQVLSSQGNQPATIPVRYDPQFPGRAWIEGLGWHDENGLFWFSLSALALQAITMLILVLFLLPCSPSGHWPWWWEVSRVIPLAAEVFCMLGMGLIDRFMDSIT